MKTLMIILTALIPLSLQAQSLERQVIGNAGGSGGDNTLQVNYTVGEVMTTTFETNDLILTQGFHQTGVTIIGIEKIPPADWTVEHYPNPASHQLNVNIAGDVTGTLQLQVVDVQGRIVYRAQLRKGTDNLQHQITLSDWAAGTYYLTIARDSGPPRSLPFQKIR